MYHVGARNWPDERRSRLGASVQAAAGPECYYIGACATVRELGVGKSGLASDRELNTVAQIELQRGREAYHRRAWTDAHAILSRIDQETPLGAEDLERLAMSAYLTNRDEDCLRSLERCYHALCRPGEACAGRARARSGLASASPVGARLGPRPAGSPAPSASWTACPPTASNAAISWCPCVEQQLAEGDWDDAFDTATGAAAIGRCFQDADLVACALHLQGRALIRKGEVKAGLTLLDEAMVAVIADELSPLMTGLIYCSVIMACQEVYALGRAQQWTSALARWCDAQPQIVAFTGACLVHRAEILQLGGAWRDAIEEAGRACERFRTGIDPQPPAPAFYQRAEMHRLRGAFLEAEADYRRASRYGCEPQPGLALLRLAQGRKAAAAAGIRRVIGATEDPLRRARLLPAQVEIALAAGEIEEADRACRELERIAAGLGRRRAGGDRGAGPWRDPVGRRRRRGRACLAAARPRSLAGDRGAVRDSARPGPDWTCLRGACRCGRGRIGTRRRAGSLRWISAPSRTSPGSMPSSPAGIETAPTV